MKVKEPTPNPAGKKGKPLNLSHLTFDEAVRKMLATEPPKPEPKAPKPPKKSAPRK